MGCIAIHNKSKNEIAINEKETYLKFSNFKISKIKDVL